MSYGRSLPSMIQRTPIPARMGSKPMVILSKSYADAVSAKMMAAQIPEPSSHALQITNGSISYPKGRGGTHEN